jgi:3-methyladenine DNA glycosylase AlkC
MSDPFKNRFFQRPFFEQLADAVAAKYKAFDRARFFSVLYDATWDGLELKGRLRHASEALGQVLPADYLKALKILLQIEKDFSGFDHLLFADFVERFGVDHFEPSMAALEVFTRTSAEFAVRPFIRRYPEQAFVRVLAWTASDQESLRRLASEGCRPRLPWGTALAELKKDPAPILPVLERLKDDPSEYVRRSVANNLGDIAKDHPDLAIDVAERWLRESPDRAPLVKHALRDLLKKGNARALHLFGVGHGPKVRVVRIAVSPRRVPLGGTATLHVELVSTASKAQALRLDYLMTYARPGGRTGKKVFKLAEIRVPRGGTFSCERKLNFVDRTIRTHHAGPHAVTIVANGESIGRADFSLV